MAKKPPRKYRLSFGGTAAKKWAPSLTAAVRDARYWVDWGQKRVCIDRVLPSGQMRRIRCLVRRPKR